MIPDTLGAVVAFFMFVAPGIIWARLLGRRRPAARTTSLQEASWVVLASAVFSLVSSAATWILVVNFFRSTGVDLRHWAFPMIIDKAHPRPPLPPSVIWTMLAESGIASTLPFAADRLFGKRIFGPPTISPASLWQRVFKTTAPLEAVATVAMTDGRKIRGHVAYWSADGDAAERELGLAQPLTLIEDPSGGGPKTIDSTFLLLAASQIKSIEVVYVPNDTITRVREMQRARQTR